MQEGFRNVFDFHGKREDPAVLYLHSSIVFRTCRAFRQLQCVIQLQKEIQDTEEELVPKHVSSPAFGNKNRTLHCPRRTKD